MAVENEPNLSQKKQTNMAYTDINSEDRLVQATFADQLEKTLGWESVYAWNQESFGPSGTLGRASEREVVLVRDLRASAGKVQPDFAGGSDQRGGGQAHPP